MLILFHVEQLSAQHDEQDVDITGRDAGNSRGLTDGIGVNGLEFLAGFGRDLMYPGIVKLSLEGNVVKSCDTVGNECFTLDIPPILDGYLCGLDDLVTSQFLKIVQFAMEFRQDLGKRVDIELWPQEQVMQPLSL